MMGGAVLTVMDSSGRDKEENKGQADVKNKGFLKQQGEMYVSIYVWTERTLKE